MSKKNPTATDGPAEIPRGESLKEFAENLKQKIDGDESAASDWLAKKAEFYDRRYARSATEPVRNFPWPDASNIVIPLIDIHCKEGIPPLMNLTFGPPRIYNMQPRNAAAKPRASKANMVMQDIHENRMPDYFMQKMYTADSTVTYGIAFEKSYYSKITTQSVESVRKEDLPPALASLAIFEDVSEVDEAAAASIGKVVMTREEFDEARDQIRDIVEAEYDLDPDEPIDKQAIEDILDFIRDPSATRVVVKRRAVLEDTPRLVNVKIDNIILPEGTRSIETAERVTERLSYFESELKQVAHDNDWNADALNIILDKARANARQPDQDVGLSRQDRLLESRNSYGGVENQFEIWEVYCYWDIDNDGLDERVVITLEPDSCAVLKAIPLPFDHGEWPYTMTMLEANDQSVRGPRSIGEQIDDMDKHTTSLARAEQDGLSIETSRSFTRVRGSNVPDEIQWMPGLIIDVDSPDDLRPIEMRTTSLALEQPMSGMMALSQRAVQGSPSPFIDSNEPERRTATQVNATRSSGQQIAGVRGMLWQHAQKRNGYLIWSLWRQYGPKNFEVSLTGQEPVGMSQAQIRGNFLVMPAGAIADMDPGFRFQRALQVHDINMRMAQALGDDIRGAPDLWQSWMDLLEEFDPLMAQRLMKIRKPDEIKQLMAQRDAMAQRQQQIADVASRWKANALVKPEEAVELYEEILKTTALWGKIQQIETDSQQITAGAERTRLLSGVGPAQNGAAQ